jgi:hypothetical protein
MTRAPIALFGRKVYRPAHDYTFRKGLRSRNVQDAHAIDIAVKYEHLVRYLKERAHSIAGMSERRLEPRT